MTDVEMDEDMSLAVGDQAGPGLQCTPKIPPSFDGRSSWFAYEEAVDDWVDISTLDAEKQGPSLKNRLEGDAAIYKSLLDRDRLRDPDHGVRPAADRALRLAVSVRTNVRYKLLIRAKASGDVEQLAKR